MFSSTFLVLPMRKLDFLCSGRLAFCERGHLCLKNKYLVEGSRCQRLTTLWRSWHWELGPDVHVPVFPSVQPPGRKWGHRAEMLWGFCPACSCHVVLSCVLWLFLSVRNTLQSPVCWTLALCPSCSFSLHGCHENTHGFACIHSQGVRTEDLIDLPTQCSEKLAPQSHRPLEAWSADVLIKSFFENGAEMPFWGSPGYPLSPNPYNGKHKDGYLKSSEQGKI